jgi:hypothetical protein
LFIPFLGKVWIDSTKKMAERDNGSMGLSFTGIVVLKAYI